MATPDVTKAQLLALVQAAIAVAVSLGVHIGEAAQVEVLSLSGVVATIVVAADVGIRRGRQKHLGAGANVSTIIDVLTGLGLLPGSNVAPSTPAVKPAMLQLDKITAEVPPDRPESGGDDTPANPPSAL